MCLAVFVPLDANGFLPSRGREYPDLDCLHADELRQRIVVQGRLLRFVDAGSENARGLGGEIDALSLVHEISSLISEMKADLRSRRRLGCGGGHGFRGNFFRSFFGRSLGLRCVCSRLFA